MVILYILIAVLLLIILFLSAKIKIIFEYKKYPGEKLYTELNLKIGFLSLTRLLNKKAKKQKKKETVPSPHEKEKTFKDKVKNYTKTFKILTKVYSKNRWKIQKTLIIDNVDIHIKFGLFDAAQTGIATGAVWTMLYSGLALCSAAGTVKKHFFEVAPVFTEAGFMSQGSIRLSVRVFSAVVLALRLYVTYNVISKENK